WSLSRRAPLLIARAKALATATIIPTDEKQTFLMPPRVDAILLLSLDYDPVDDRIAAIGYQQIRDGKIAREALHVPESSTAKAESDAIVAVLGPLIEDLSEIDATNAAGTREIYAHIFLYEPTEAINLQRAVGRHLDDSRVR